MFLCCLVLFDLGIVELIWDIPGPAPLTPPRPWIASLRILWMLIVFLFLPGINTDGCQLSRKNGCPSSSPPTSNVPLLGGGSSSSNAVASDCQLKQQLASPPKPQTTQRAASNISSQVATMTMGATMDSTNAWIPFSVKQALLTFFPNQGNYVW